MTSGVVKSHPDYPNIGLLGQLLSSAMKRTPVIWQNDFAKKYRGVPFYHPSNEQRFTETILGMLGKNPNVDLYRRKKR